MPDEYVSSNPNRELRDDAYEWERFGKLRGLGRLTVVEPFAYQHPGGSNLMDRIDLFGVVAIGDLSPNQIELLLVNAKKPKNVCSASARWEKATHNFEMYIVKKINKMPETKFGRIVKIETWGSTVTGICLNKYKNPNRIQFTIFTKGMDADNEQRKLLISEIAIRLEGAWNRSEEL